MSDLRNFFNELFQFNIPFDEYQTKDEYILVGDVAGVSKENWNVNYHNGIVKISGSRECQKNINMFTERWCGTFTRDFVFPGATTDKITAQLKDGVLEVKVPKSEPKKPAGTDIHIQ
ncbi:heat shock protein Hsp20 domain-containing protein [Heterostelium album PN500]|uniref:Heat shock protein Hsp20 domain-containing protein n=1 Tax=Heterostelium pallidum (strain ATCC 26659 / Pp 5 / PN500) TaxID=670386 RepID=D3B536_HETP5|nr:heat shock protein Hsp20 domain-containing protein [Heterostelium album PN500]EFA83401.1 heat shock protein Hsp20 domain-containing protein [Heterostelium album PN500]|eukprot:XP_020435518.1 heat shock protein Hsp20 domain-containing protein [Heterostelium album PN500]